MAKSQDEVTTLLFKVAHLTFNDDDVDALVEYYKGPQTCERFDQLNDWQRNWVRDIDRLSAQEQKS